MSNNDCKMSRKYFISCSLALLFATAIPIQAQKQKARELQPTPLEKQTGHTSAPTVGQARFMLPDGVKLEDGVTEDEAVAIALWNNAALHADLALLGLARADLIDAGLLRNPILQLVLPLGPYRQLESALTFPFEVFWQRKKRVAAATGEVQRVAQGLEQNALHLARDVRLAWADWWVAHERARLASEAVVVRQQIVKLTNVRLRVGDISEIETMAARVDESLALEQAARFKRETITARDRLRQLLGASESSHEFQLPSDTTPAANAPLALKVRDGVQVKFDDLLQAAFESRPDLRSAELGIEAAAKRAKWEHSRIVTLAGLLNIKQGEGVSFAPRPGFVAELPVFNRNQGGIARADAEVERAAWQYLSVRQRIAAEVQEAFNQMNQVRQTLAYWQNEIIPQAEETTRLSNRSYTRGDQSYLFVLDATRRLVDVRLREVDLHLDVRRAIIQLDRSLGRKFDAKP